MGIFDFAREAGEKLREKAADFFNGDAEAAEAAQQEIKDTVQRSEVAVDDLEVKVEGDRAVLRGRAGSQEAREKAILLAGNTYGIGQVDDQMETDDATPGAKFYTVQSGDTLSKIAREFYGDAGKYPVIFEANRPMLKDPDKIYPGQTLRIPAL